MAEVNANSLPAKTDLGTNDSAIVVDQTTNAGALVDLDVLADKVLDRITSKTFANQVGGSSAATLLAQLSTLNSKLPSGWNSIQSSLTWGESIEPTTSVSSVVRNGHFVQLSLVMVAKEGVTTTSHILEGLPAPPRMINCMAQSSQGGKDYRCTLNTSGTLSFYYGDIPAVGSTFLLDLFYMDGNTI